MRRPNLFEFATKELSQDAFVCWLSAWSNPEYRLTDNALHETGTYFVQELLKKKGIEIKEINTIEVKSQKRRIDISIVVNNEYFIIIEDKIHSKAHGNQLQKYFEIARDELKYPENKIVPIFLKTSYQAHYFNENYELFLLEDFAKIIEFGREHCVKDPIFLDFANIISQRIDWIEEYKTKNISEWGYGWIGFFKEMQNSANTNWIDWGYIQNQLGGFHGMWAHFCKTNEPNTEQVHFLMKQVKGQEDAEIQFLIEPKGISGHERKLLKYHWADRFARAGTAIGVKVEKVKRFGEGKNMAVAIFADKVIYRLDDGSFDKEKTLEAFDKCKKIIEIASAS